MTFKNDLKQLIKTISVTFKDMNAENHETRYEQADLIIVYFIKKYPKLNLKLDNFKQQVSISVTGFLMGEDLDYIAEVMSNSIEREKHWTDKKEYKFGKALQKAVFAVIQQVEKDPALDKDKFDSIMGVQVDKIVNKFKEDKFHPNEITKAINQGCMAMMVEEQQKQHSTSH